MSWRSKLQLGFISFAVLGCQIVLDVMRSLLMDCDKLFPRNVLSFNYFVFDRLATLTQLDLRRSQSEIRQHQVSGKFSQNDKKTWFLLISYIRSECIFNRCWAMSLDHLQWVIDGPHLLCLLVCLHQEAWQQLAQIQVQVCKHKSGQCFVFFRSIWVFWWILFEF